MKKKILALSFTAIVCLWPTGYAQTADETPKPQKSKGSPFGGEGPMRDKMRERFMENLSPENRERFEAVREKALQDPELQELRKNADKAGREFFKAMRDKMLEIDPGLADIVKNNAGKGPKVAKNEEGSAPGMSDSPEGSKKDGEDGKGPKGQGRWHHKPKEGSGGTGLANLTDEERQKYMAAREKAKEDPTVQAAEKKKQEAETPDARQTATEEYRKAMNEAIVKVDPSLAPLVEKMTPQASPKLNATNTPAGTMEGANAAPQMQME